MKEIERGEYKITTSEGKDNRGAVYERVRMTGRLQRRFEGPFKEPAESSDQKKYETAITVSMNVSRGDMS